MTPQDQEQIRRWHDSAGPLRPITLVSAGNGRSAALVAFCDRLAENAPALRIHRRAPEDRNELPAIVVEDRIRYHAVPEGPELAPFLDAVAAAGADGLPEAVRRRLSDLDLPATLRIFIASGCPHCPRVVRKMLPFGALPVPIEIVVIDGALFPELIDGLDIRAVPTVMVDDRFRWTGSVGIEEIVETLIRRDPARIGPSALRNLIESGKAAEAARIMATAGTVFPAMIDLLAHDKWPVRLGAMVAMEELAALDASVAATAVPLLRERLETVDDTVRGDLLHVLGEIGGPELIALMETIAAGTGSEDVRDAAGEAAEAIRERNANG